MDLNIANFTASFPGSCFDKFPDFDVTIGQSSSVIAYGNTSGDFNACERRCQEDWSCYAFTQYFVGESPHSGKCYGRGYGENILTVVDTPYTVVSGVKIPCRYSKLPIIIATPALHCIL